MLRLAFTRLSRPSSLAATASTILSRPTPLLVRPFSAPIKQHCANELPNVNPVAVQMINYALGLARSQRSDESYGQALLVLEQCLASQSQEGEDAAVENLRGMVFLAVSTLLSERGNTDEAIQTLLKIQNLTSSSLDIRVAAVEALVGLNLELGLDDTSSVIADNCLKLLEKEGKQISDEFKFKVLNGRAKAIKGLVDLVQSNMDSAKMRFDGCEGGQCAGNSALSYGEYLHVRREFPVAKEAYQIAISASTGKNSFSDDGNVAACNMVAEEVLLAATCALGQLESHMGNFGDAEGTLTTALKLAEGHFGSHHPKVGIFLTCIALMYHHKSISERSSTLIVQEGLYRKALGLLKAPSLDIDSTKETIEKRDILALARGGYAEALCVQENRKLEGERMMSWANAAWKNRRLSLAEAVDISEPSSKVPVIDTRICRAL